MRTEQEMMQLILSVAKRDERIRAVAINGSRANPTAPKDIFQDFDIVYIVTDVDSFIDDKDWIDIFGERIIMQTPDNMAMFPTERGRRFAYLMQFADGNRIDLTLVPIDEAEINAREDKLTVILLDKDSCMPEIPAPTDEDYRVKPPSAEFFADCCNEFWWVSIYVAKGLWRREILYAKKHLDENVRPMLIKMLEWQVGIQTGFSVSVGKYGKHLERYLSEDNWQALLSTYADGSYEGTWKALFAACDLFRVTGEFVATHFNYEYPYQDDRRVTAFLKHIKELPRDAKEIY